MIRSIYLLFLFLLLSGQQSKLVKTKISDNIMARLPSDFYLLPPEELQSKSVSYRMPIAYYTNPEKEIDFSVNNSASKWQGSNIDLIREFYKSNIMNLFDDVKILHEDIVTINNREFIVFEFYGTILPGESLFRQENPDRKYFYIQYTVKENQILIFTFIAPGNKKEQWEGTASAIMQSIKIN